MAKENPESLGDEWLGTNAAARRLGVTPRTLYRLINESGLPAYKFGRVIRLRAREVDEFIERSRIQAGDLRHLYPPEPGDAGEDGEAGVEPVIDLRQEPGGDPDDATGDFSRARSDSTPRPSDP